MPDTETATDILDPIAAQPAVAEAVAAPAVAPEAPAQPDKTAEPTSALEAALKALDKGKVASATAAQPADDAAHSESTQPGQPEDRQDESLADVHKIAPDVFSALPKEARAAFNQLRKQVGTLRPDAERGQAVAAFIRASGVTPEEFAELQDVGALMKRDPAKAREALLQHLDRLDTVLGIKLPDDIRQDVDGGYLSEDRATELSQARARAAALEHEVGQRDAAAAADSMRGALEAWEMQARRTDPDMDRKLPSLMREVKLTLLERAQAGRPVRLVEDAVAIAQAAYGTTNEMWRASRPASNPVPRAPSSAVSSVPSAAPEPTTPLEVVYAALARRRERG